MKINGNAIRPGNVIEHQGGLWVAVRIQHTQPGKGGAYLQVELKNIRDGRKLNERFRSSESVERVRLDQKDYQYLFEADGKYTFMDQESYEQIEIDGDFLGDQAAFLQDGMMVVVESYEGEPLAVNLPEHVTVEILETEPVVKGQTATSSYKPAVATNNVRIMVPPFINVGDRVVVATEDATYVKRAEA